MQPEQLGRYRINGVLGRGGMGVVYEGHDPQIDRVVAIKTIALDELSEEGKSIFESRFRAEMRSAGRLQHHNIVALYDTGRDGGTAYIVMERVHGQDLKRHLASGVRFSVEQSVDLVLQLLSALEFAHRHDVIHRDVKPANVMLQSDGVIKLCDFGVARLNDADATRTQGMVVGSLRYSSPEQVSGLPVDARTDVFAAGVLLFELLTHRLPFEGGSDVESLYRIAHQQAPSPRSVDASIPPEIDSAVARALAKDPKDRFANAAEFAIALGGSSVRRADTTSPRPPMPAGVASGALAAATVPPGRATYATVTEGAAAPQPGGRRAWVAAVVVGVLVAVFGGLYYVLRPGRVPEAVAGRQAVPASTPSAVAAVATTAPVPPATFTTSTPVASAAVATLAPRPRALPGESTASARKASASIAASTSRPAIPAAAATVAQAPAAIVTGPSSAEGTWLGVLSCSALIPAQEFQGKPFVARIVVDVKGPHVSWVRSDKMFTETVQGTIDAAGHIVATGEGNEIFDDGRRGRWRVELKGEFRPREHLVGAAVQMRRWSDSSLARECTLRAEHS